MIPLETLDAAAELVHPVVPPTPQYCWPLLSRRVGAEIWVKHENHTPIGAFKLRGGLVYLDDLKRSQPGDRRGDQRDHRQSRPEHRLCRDAARAQVATIVVPHGNSPEKNRAMVGFGADARRARPRLPGRLRTRDGAWPSARTCTRCARSTRCWCAAWRATGSSCSARCPISMSSMCRSASAAAFAG